MPTYIFNLACLLADMIEVWLLPRNPAIESDTKTGYISWYDFTEEIYRQAGYDTKVTPVITTVRPYNLHPNKSKLVKNGFKLLSTWLDAVRCYLEILKKEGFFN